MVATSLGSLLELPLCLFCSFPSFSRPFVPFFSMSNALIQLGLPYILSGKSWRIANYQGTTRGQTEPPTAWTLHMYSSLVRIAHTCNLTNALVS